MRNLFLLFFLLPIICESQNYDEKLFNYKNGLPANKVFDLVEDTNKLIWLGTDKGLVRFDGSNFVKIEVKKYANRTIRKLKLYQNKLFIFYQNGGLNELDLISSTDKLLYKSDVNDVCLRNDSLWVLHSKGILELKLPVKKRIYNLNIYKKNIINYGCLEYFQNKIFISLPKIGICSFNIKKGTLKKHNRTAPGYYERFLVVKNQLFFVRTKLPQKFNSNKQNFETIQLQKFINDFNNDYLVYQNNNYFISDYTTFYKQIGNKTIKLYDTKKIELIKLLIHDDNYYFATNKGLLRLPFTNKFIMSIDLDNINNENYVRVRRKIIKSKDSILLFGFPYIYVWKGNQLFKATNSIASNYDAIKYKKGYLVCNDGIGLVYYKHNFKKRRKIAVKSYNYSSEGDFTTIYYDYLAHHILLGNKKYIYIVSQDFNVQRKFKIPFQNFSVKKILKHTKTSYLVGTDNGLFLLNINGKTTTINDIKGKVIGDMSLDQKRSILYLGHENGLELLNSKTLKSIKQVKFYELINPKVSALVIDKKNRVWCSTYSGLVCYDVHKDKTITLDYTDGLLNSEYNYKSAATIGTTKLIFGGLDGYDIINTEKFIVKDKKIKGKFTGVSLFSRADTLYFSNTSKIEYNGDEYFSRIYFSPVNNIDISKCKFKYALNEGQWISLFEKSSIDLIGLEPHTHVLKVEGVDQFGNKIVFPTIEINVRKPFLQTEEFIYIVFLIIVTLIIFITYKSVQTKKEKLKIYDHIAMDLHDEVGNILTHLILLVKSRTDINALKKKIIEQLMVANYGLRVYINTTTKKAMSLEAFNDELVEELTKITSYHNIQFSSIGRYDVERTITTTLGRDLKLVIFEIINNAVKHAHPQLIEYKIIASKKVVQITIKDDGCGFDKTLSYKGKGLKNINKRINDNKGHVELRSNPNGTTYIITIRK